MLVIVIVVVLGIVRSLVEESRQVVRNQAGHDVDDERSGSMGPRFLLALVSGCSIFSSVVTSSSSGLSHCECRQPRVTVGTVSVFLPTASRQAE